MQRFTTGLMIITLGLLPHAHSVSFCHRLQHSITEEFGKRRVGEEITQGHDFHPGKRCRDYRYSLGLFQFSIVFRKPGLIVSHDTVRRDSVLFRISRAGPLGFSNGTVVEEMTRGRGFHPGKRRRAYGVYLFPLVSQGYQETWLF